MSGQRKVTKRKTGRPGSHAVRQSKAAGRETPRERLERVVRATVRKVGGQ